MPNKLLLSLVSLILFWIGPVHAAPMALVGDEEGHAVLVKHRGNCYAIMPNHVAARERMALVTALPQKTGLAIIFHRQPKLDLALAYVEGDLIDQCNLSWSGLARDLSRVIADSTSGGLSRIQYGGQFIDRAKAVIVDADDNKFEIVTTEKWSSAEIMGGVSGALFFIDTIPVGIALSSENTNRARFLRMDRVFEALSGILNAGSSSHPASLQITGADKGLGYRITSQIRVSNGTKRGVADATKVNWDGAQIELEFTLSNDLPVRLDQIFLETFQNDNKSTLPQQIKVELDRGMPGHPFWVEIFAPDMSPSGKLKINTGKTFARRVRLSVLSVWHPDRPMRIDRVVFK